MSIYHTDGRCARPPKLLRPYFLHHRDSLGKLCQVAWHTVGQAEATAEEDGVAHRHGGLKQCETSHRRASG
jgi:hypothetical protein